TGLLTSSAPPYGGRIDIAVPLIESFPEAPDVSLVQLHLVIGPRGLTYYEHVAGKLVPYKPKGLTLPNRCPRGGYPFALELSFLDGSHAGDATNVPCARLVRDHR
ncbi:MAG TPA: hypothetical protein VK707_05400, partial [Solirubrobacteraceae bacterium]|nr:hypothetical protein [Solirubrobacteraceae bacterium]